MPYWESLGLSQAETNKQCTTLSKKCRHKTVEMLTGLGVSQPRTGHKLATSKQSKTLSIKINVHLRIPHPDADPRKSPTKSCTQKPKLRHQTIPHIHKACRLHSLSDNSGEKLFHKLHINKTENIRLYPCPASDPSIEEHPGEEAPQRSR